MKTAMFRFAACLLGFAATAGAQPARPPQLQSPVVQPDRQVTFSVRAPNAQEVELSGQFQVSGTTDTEETWFRAGRANFILDNLIAQKKAVPMIVVMPYGNMMMGTPPPTSPQAADMYRVFNDELVANIIPYVESNYRAILDREKRAIAGFSRGGGQSLFTAFNNPDKFA